MSEPNTRDHLANERTFLAWVRTAIALLGFGVVIARLRFLFVSGAAPAPGPHAGVRSTLLGLTFAAAGPVTLLVAYGHYEQTRRAIDAGEYRASSRLMFVFVAVIFLLGLVSVAYLLTLAPA